MEGNIQRSPKPSSPNLHPIRPDFGAAFSLDVSCGVLLSFWSTVEGYTHFLLVGSVGGDCNFLDVCGAWAPRGYRRLPRTLYVCACLRC